MGKVGSGLPMCGRYNYLSMKDLVRVSAVRVTIIGHSQLRIESTATI